MTFPKRTRPLVQRASIRAGLTPYALSLGVLASACEQVPRAPLCDEQGAPACGNIGQHGRPVDKREQAQSPLDVSQTNAAAAAPAVAAPTRHADHVGKPRAAAPLVTIAPGAMTASTRPAKPLTDAEMRAACGNVMTKRAPVDSPECNEWRARASNRQTAASAR